MLGQRVDAQIRHQLWIVQDDPGDFFFRAGEIVRTFPQPQQGIAHVSVTSLFHEKLFHLFSYLCKIVFSKLYAFLAVPARKSSATHQKLKPFSIETSWRSLLTYISSSL